MKVLFFHGLGGSLQEDKRNIIVNVLGKKRTVVNSPELDYEDIANKGVDLIGAFDSYVGVWKPDVIIGNSMGGFLAFHIANKFSIPCFLTNPALPETTLSYSWFGKNLQKIKNPKLNYFVLGALDQVVEFNSNLNYINNLNLKNSKISISEKEGHSMSMKTFKDNLKMFRDSL
jgi:esterase/lipase